MALQGSGQIRLSQINTELGRSATANISLRTAETGGYGAINTCAIPYPNSNTPTAVSEWYGYNHLAPCSNAVASYYFDGGVQASDKLSSGRLKDYPNTPLQAEIQGQFSMSVWARADNILAASAAMPGYQRFHGFWWLEDQTNGYYAEITYDPSYGNGVDNFITLTISAGINTNNYRFWQVPLDGGGINLGITGVDLSETWHSLNAMVNKNSNGFVHLTFVYDVNETVIEDQFKVYWNGQLLGGTVYGDGVNGSGPAGIPYGGNVYAYFGQGRLGGNTINTPGIWYGHLGWLTWVNNYAFVSTVADQLYNYGTPFSAVDTINIEPAVEIQHWTFATNINPQPSQNVYNIPTNLTNSTAAWSNTVYP